MWICSWALAAELHKAPTGVTVSREDEVVRVERGEEVVQAEGEVIEVVAFGRLWIVNGDTVVDRPPLPAQTESVALGKAMDLAHEAGCPVGVKKLSTEWSTGSVTVSMGRDREQVCTATIGIHTLEMHRYEGPPPEPEHLTLAPGETREWHGMTFSMEAFGDPRGFTTIQVMVDKRGDTVMLAGNLYETDPMFYLEGGAHGRLIRVQTIPGGVVVLDEEMPKRMKLRVDQLDHVPDDARAMGCRVENEAFHYDERYGSAYVTFRDDDGMPTCLAIVGLISGEVVAVQP